MKKLQPIYSLKEVSLSLFVFTLLLTFANCSDDNSEPSIKNTWMLEKIVTYNNDVVMETLPVGTTTESEYLTDLPCEGGYEEVEVTEEGTIDYLYYTFSSNNAFVLEAKTHEKNFDSENSECNIVYRDDVYYQNREGEWTIDNDKKLLTITFIEDDHEETIRPQFKIQQGRLILSSDFEHKNRSEQIFRLKK